MLKRLKVKTVGCLEDEASDDIKSLTMRACNYPFKLVVLLYMTDVLFQNAQLLLLGLVVTCKVLVMYVLDLPSDSVDFALRSPEGMPDGLDFGLESLKLARKAHTLNQACRVDIPIVLIDYRDVDSWH